MIPARRRFFALLAIPPLAVLAAAGLYMIGMSLLEKNPRDLLTRLEWAAETTTTTGYGADARWRPPAMILFVISMQFFGVVLL